MATEGNIGLSEVTRNIPDDLIDVASTQSLTGQLSATTGPQRADLPPEVQMSDPTDALAGAVDGALNANTETPNAPMSAPIGSPTCTTGGTCDICGLLAVL